MPEGVALRSEKAVQGDDENSSSTIRKEVLVFWVPNELLDRMTEEEREKYRKVEGRSTGSASPKDEVEDGMSSAVRCIY